MFTLAEGGSIRSEQRTLCNFVFHIVKIFQKLFIVYFIFYVRILNEKFFQEVFYE